MSETPLDNPSPQEAPQEPVVEATTIAGADPTQEPAVPVSQMPDNWREIMSGGDEKLSQLLGRYASPDAAGKALLEARRKISDGSYQKPLGENPSEEEISLYREMNGIPSTPEGYEVKLSDGRVLGDEEKPFVDEYLKVAHNYNMPPDAANGMLDWYYQTQEQRAMEADEQDVEYRRQSTDTLREQWGGDFRQNVNLMNSLFDQAPEGFKDAFYGARLADGTLLGDNPEALNFLVGLAREVNPAATVVPGSGAGAMQSITEELSKYQKMMGDYESEYWKGPQAEFHQKRYEELLNAQTKLK